VTDPQDAGPLTVKVFAFEDALRRLVPSVQDPSDWDPLKDLVATEHFERIGTFMETQNWELYTEMLTQWAGSIDSFETSVRRISELSGLVYYEIEERHHRGKNVNIVNTLTVFEFDETGRIRHLNVFLQQPR
jgi:hypothetical protein